MTAQVIQRAPRRIPALHANPVYDLSFAPVRDDWSHLTLSDTDGTHHLRVRLDDTALAARSAPHVRPFVADVLDLALAIHTADRVTPHSLDGPVRHLRISLPVREPSRLHSVQALLEELLWFTTGSEWRFSFSRRNAPSRASETPTLPLVQAEVEIALWSGGLDALAGLDTQSRARPGQFLLLRTGGNDGAIGRQRDVHKHLPDAFRRRASFLQIPLRIENADRRHQNTLSRARGVAFALVGSAVASCFDQDRLAVYENGIGALNLPYSEADLGPAHSRSVHPETHQLLSRLLSVVMERPFEVVNPFLFSTKAEMLAGLAADNQRALVALTSSCDSPHRKSGQRS